MKSLPRHKRKSNPKNKHQWGKSFFQDLDRISGGKGNEERNEKTRGANHWWMANRI